MQEYIINVAEIEELQTLGDTDALDNIFARAERTIVGGGLVALTRKTGKNRGERFEEFSTEEDLAAYKRNVYKYLNK